MEKPPKTTYIRCCFANGHMRLCTRFFKVNNDQKLFLMCKMVLEWREREHGDVEEAVQGDLMAQQALHVCSLYKFWCLGSLRAKPRIL